MKKKLCVYLSALILLTTFFKAQSQSVAYKAIFIDTFDAIVGNTAKEDSLLHYLKDSSYNSIICYQVSSVVSSVLNSTKNTNLANFLKKARTQYGIKNVSASSEIYDTFRDMISPYNRSRVDSNERFNYYYLEFEFWNVHSTSTKSSANNGYYCTNYLSPKGYNCDTAGAFKYYRKMLKSMDSLATKDGIRSSTYVGKPNSGQAKFIANTVDLILCDNYTVNISSIYTNCVTRYSYFGSTNKTVQIVPIFASYSPDGTFFGDWLVKAPVGPHSEKGIYANYFLPRFNAETGTWKSKVNLVGYAWYRYSGMPHNGNYSAATCTPPANITSSSISSAAATLNWTAAGSGTGYSIHYRVTGSSTWTGPLSVLGTSTTITSLVPLTSYEFQVKTSCSSASSSYSSSALFTTLASVSCSSVTGLSAASITNASATLNWLVAAGAISYSVRYRATGATTWSNTTSTLATITISGLAASSIYEFQVQSICSLGSSSYSASYLFSTNAIPCGIPSGLSAGSITTNSAILNWTTISGVSGYTLQYRIIGTSTWLTTTSNTNSKSILALEENSLYEFQVQTNCTSTNASSFSASGTFTTLTSACGTPTSISASAATTNSFTVSWIGSSAATSYIVQYKLSTSSSWTSTTSAGTLKNISSLVTATSYQYKVAMVCSSGTSAYSATGTISTLSNTSSCGVPTGLFVTDYLPNSVTLNWLPVNGANLYTLQYRKTGTTTWTIKSTSFTNKGISSLLANTSYEFMVRTDCSNNSSSYSAIYSFSTSASASRMNSPAIIQTQNANDSTNKIEALIVNQNPVEFKIFPNPAENDNINLRIQVNQKEEVRIFLFDMLGKLIYSQTALTNESGFAEISLKPAFELKVGIYQIMGYTINMQQKLTCKLVVQ